MTTTPTSRPLACTRCGSACNVAEDVELVADYGPAVIDHLGVVRPADPDYQADKTDGAPIRTRACCTKCHHQWTLRRRFDPIALES